MSSVLDIVSLLLLLILSFNLFLYSLAIWSSFSLSVSNLQKIYLFWFYLMGSFICNFTLTRKWLNGHLLPFNILYLVHFFWVGYLPRHGVSDFLYDYQATSRFVYVFLCGENTSYIFWHHKWVKLFLLYLYISCNLNTFSLLIFLLRSIIIFLVLVSIQS